MVAEIEIKTYVSDYEDLQVYKRAFVLSLAIHQKALGFPKYEQYELASQMRRASKSICANIAEGFSKQQFSAPEFKRFLSMALASCNEMKVWTDYAYALGYINQAICGHWKGEYDSLRKMIAKLHLKIE